jgi:pilus assembly protein CpaF
MGNMGLPSRAIKTQILSAVDVIVQGGRQRDGARRVIQLTELVGLEGEVMTMHDVFDVDHEGEDMDGHLLGRWRGSRSVPSFHERLLAGRRPPCAAPSRFAAPLECRVQGARRPGGCARAAP